jgi:recombination protein RecT
MTASTEIPSKQVAKPKPTIKDLLLSEQFRMQIAKALPSHMNAERFARIALTLTQKTPQLLRCTQESLFNCLLELAPLGLEPDGRRAHLIPRHNKDGTVQCTLIIDYKGVAELMRRNGEVAYIHCDVVGENDQFDYRFGTGGKLVHIPASGDRGRIIGAYSFIRLKDGTEEYEFMSFEDIERIRKRSKAGNDGPWVTDWNEMAKKTVFRRHSKTLPLSPEMRDVIEHDDEAVTEQERFAAAKPASVASVATPQTARRPRGTSVRGELEFVEEEPPASQSEKEQEPDQATQVAQVQALLTENGYTESELLTVLRNVRLVTDKQPANSVAELTARVLAMVLEDPDNTLRRLAAVRSAA